MSVYPEGMDGFLRLEFAAEQSDYDHFHPDFRYIIQSLDFVESYDAQEWHKLGISNEPYDVMYEYRLLQYMQLCLEGLGSYDDIPSPYQMDQIYGINLSIADIHYQSGRYASCLLELDRIAYTMHTSGHELLADIQCLQQHAYNLSREPFAHSQIVDIGQRFFPKMTDPS